MAYPEDLSARFEKLIINNSAVKREKKDGVFKCKYCERKFTNPQALGGHQNAHRAEREREKQKLFPQYRLDTSSGGRAPKCERYYQGPAFGSSRGFGLLGLGIQPTSMIRKPSSHLGFGQVAHHRNAWRSAAAYQLFPTNHQQEASWVTDNVNHSFASASFNTNGFVRGRPFGMPDVASSVFQSGSTLAAFQNVWPRSKYPETAQIEEPDLELRLGV